MPALVACDHVVTCLPAIQEVLQGFLDAGVYRTAREAMFAPPIVEAPLRAEVFLEAADLFRSARQEHLAVRSSMECLIAAGARRHDVEVRHRDRDFTALARIAPVRQRTL